MQSKQPPLDLFLSINDQTHQHPEDSLRVISNYSSLERMYNKSKQSKIYSQYVVPKRDYYNIAGWEYSNTKEKEMKSIFNRTKFKSASLPSNTLVLTQTIATQRVSHNKSTPRRRLSPASQKIIQTTNFKFRRMGQKKQDARYRTLSFDSQNRFQEQSLKQKKEIIRFYENEAMKRKQIRQNYRPNPQICLPLTEYPIMNGVKGQKGYRRLRRQQFVRKHQI